MYVLHITPFFPSEEYPHHGTFVKTQVDALSKEEIEIGVVQIFPYVPTILSKAIPNITKYARLSKGVEKYDRYKLLRHPYIDPKCDLPCLRTRLLKDSVGKVLSKIGEPDIVHGHAVYPAGEYANHLGKLLNIPSLITCHGSKIHTYPHKSRINKYRVLKACRSASHLVAVSDDINRKLWNLTNRKGTVNYIGIDTGRNHVACKDIESSNLYHVLYIGRVTKQKGVHDLLNAYKKANIGRASKLVVAGPRSYNIGRSVDGCNKSLELLGPVSNDQVWRLIFKSDVVVLPSYAEGLPTVIIEAGATGTPVIATDVGGIDEVITNGYSGFLFRPGDTSTLARYLEVLACHSELRELFGNRLNSTVKKSFDARRNSQNLIKIYEELINNTKITR